MQKVPYFSRLILKKASDCMKKIISLCALCALTLGSLWAQPQTNKEGSNYSFTVVKQVDKSLVPNQYRTGTCWSFSTLSFFESELMRMGKGRQALSEMFVVRHTYMDKAERYVRWGGHINFSAGGAFHDVAYVWKNYGMVPEAVYSGLQYGEAKHNHSELDQALKAFLDVIVKNPNHRLTTSWKDAVNGILDAYLGPIPKTFTYEGKEYTPKSYAASLGLNPDDYVELSSFTHHPFYQPFTLEVPDNWLQGQVYNVPVEEMTTLAFDALDAGYSLAWGADVSDKGFNWKAGLALAPAEDWEVLTASTETDVWANPTPQAKITQEQRQAAFDRYELTDDHGMHITGYAKDQNGDRYFIVKNSWGTESNECDGFFFASEAYFALLTMDYMVHKDALPKALRKKLGL